MDCHRPPAAVLSGPRRTQRMCRHDRRGCPKRVGPWRAAPAQRRPRVVTFNHLRSCRTNPAAEERKEPNARIPTNPAQRMNPAEDLGGSNGPANRTSRDPNEPSGRDGCAARMGQPTGESKRTQCRRTKANPRWESSAECSHARSRRTRRGAGRNAVPGRDALVAVRAAQAAGAARASAMPCQVVRPSSRRGPIRARAEVSWARLSRLCTGRKSSTCWMIAREPAARGA